jgi:hypothetical protein
MKNYSLLFRDELSGFRKSKVMAILLIGLPLISVLMHYFQPDTEGMPLSMLVALLIASLGGTLASVMLATAIVSERNRKVYDLFVIRDHNIRTGLIMAKFTAVFLCVGAAAAISIAFGLAVDYFQHNSAAGTLLSGLGESFAVSISAISIACSIGIFIGLIIDSVPAAAILSIYAGNQLSTLAVLPGIMIESIDPLLFSVTAGVVLTSLFLIADVLIFRKKQL